MQLRVAQGPVHAGAEPGRAHWIGRTAESCHLISSGSVQHLGPSSFVVLKEGASPCIEPCF